MADVDGPPAGRAVIDVAPDDRMHDDPGRNSLAVRVSAKLTAQLLRTNYARRLPLIGLTEFPKSGGTWVGQVLSTYLGIPMPQRPRVPVVMRALWHGHWAPPIPADLIVVRDPRDCYVSLFHHRVTMAASASRRERGRPPIRRFAELFPSAATTGRSTPDELREYLRLLLDGNQLREPDWTTFHRSWCEHGLPVAVTYQELRADPVPNFAWLVETMFGDVDERRLATSIARWDLDVVRAGPEQFTRRGVAEGGWRDEIPEDLWSAFDDRYPPGTLDPFRRRGPDCGDA